jgi:Tol biopolymer transport system component
MGSRRRQARFVFLIGALVLLGAVPGAQATYIGQNGKISFDVYSSGLPTVYTMNPNGSGRTAIAPGGGQSAWSADGKRIAYACDSISSTAFYPNNTCTANPDGSGENVLDNFGQTPQHRPFWSPDGRRLIIDDFETSGHGIYSSDIWRIDSADGGDHIHMAGSTAYSGSWSPNGRIVFTEGGGVGSPATWVSSMSASFPNSRIQLTESESDGSPDWSPDGTKIVFVSCRDSTCQLYTMDADGSNETEIPNSRSGESEPAWSPDGTKILFTRAGELYLVNRDGTGETNITNTPGVSENAPAWQPVPQPGYARPKGATPLRVSLVPAFERCEEPNRTHAPPLASGSCNPPRSRGGYASFGTAIGSKAVGHVTFKAIPGAPDSANNADVRISVNMTDVHRNFDGADALGSMELPVPLRLTDRDNGAFNAEAATVTDFNVGVTGYINNPLRVEVPCVDTADPSVGSTCSATTTVDALFPFQSGPVKEGKRSVWELDQIAVYDGGEDGYVQSRDDNTVMAVQGVFVP